MEAREPIAMTDAEPEEVTAEEAPPTTATASKPIYSTETPAEVPISDRSIRNLLGRSIT